MKAYSGSKKTSLTEKTIKLLTKCTDCLTNSTLIESQGIKRSAFATYVEEKLSGFHKRQRTIAEKRINDLLFEFKMFNFSRFSTAIFKILQSIKILTPWRTYLTVPQVVPQAQPTQWKMCQHEEIPSLIWIFLMAQSDVI